MRRLRAAVLTCAALTGPALDALADCQCADLSPNPSCDRNVCCQRMFGRNCDDGPAAGGMPLAVPGLSMGDQAALGAFNAVVSGFIGGMFSQRAYPDPAQEAQRLRILELERAQQAERDEARRRKFQADRDELLQKLMGRKFMEALQFKSLSQRPAKELEFKKLGAEPAPPERGSGELSERRRALARLKGKPEEAWCAEHITGLLCPSRPSYDMGKLYESRLAYYRSSKKEWDAKCGGPSAQPDYVDRDDCGKEPVRPQAEAKSLNFMPTDRSRPKPPTPAPTPAPERTDPAPDRRDWRTVEGEEHPSPRPPAPRDSPRLQDGGAEAVKAAGAGGFDRDGAMLGARGTPPPVPQPPPDAPASPAAARGAPDARALRGLDIPEFEAKWAALPLYPESRAPVHEAVASGKAERIGDPDLKGRDFSKQEGATCAIVTVGHLLWRVGISRNEGELLRDALAEGLFLNAWPCGRPEPGDYCHYGYEPRTGRCTILDFEDKKLGDISCAKSGAAGGLTARGIGELLSRHSRREVVNAALPPGGAGAEAELPAARKELLAVFAAGKAAAVTLDAGLLAGWSRNGGMHTVAVTSAVVAKDGPVLGYYINDPATGEVGRYVEAAAFEGAWLADDLQRVYLK
ncbi:hypothetical protein EPO15_00195 [bacterium]|nr:MAG: hypothetical protein EPO15_00195 [bacterium]